MMQTKRKAREHRAKTKCAEPWCAARMESWVDKRLTILVVGTRRKLVAKVAAVAMAVVATVAEMAVVATAAEMAAVATAAVVTAQGAVEPVLI